MNADTAPPQKSAKLAELPLRIFSAGVLGPLVIGAVLVGGTAFKVLIILAAGIGISEWVRMVEPIATPRPLRLGLLIGAFVFIAAIAFGHYPGAVTLVIGTLALGLAARHWGSARPFMVSLGLPYVCVGCLSLLWLRLQPGTGQSQALYAMLVVWATDIGAYVVGRGVGGPKLMPIISPKKTWSGLIGGMMAAAGAGAVVALAYSRPLLLPALVGAGLAVVGQAGDLLESFVKRRCGVKDSGHLIPGHGGLLDRIDGLVTVSVACALAFLLFGLPLP